MQAVLTILLMFAGLFSVFGGIVAGVWLAIKGDWGSIGYGFLSMIASPLLLTIPIVLLAVPVSFLTVHLLKNAMENGNLAAMVAGSIVGQLPMVVIMAGYFFALLLFFLTRATESTIWPLLMWVHGLSISPWAFYASKERENVYSGLMVAWLSLASLVTLVRLVFGGTSVAGLSAWFGTCMLIGLAVNGFIAARADRERAARY